MRRMASLRCLRFCSGKGKNFSASICSTRILFLLAIMGYQSIFQLNTFLLFSPTLIGYPLLEQRCANFNFQLVSGGFESSWLLEEKAGRLPLLGSMTGSSDDDAGMLIWFGRCSSVFPSSRVRPRWC